MNLRNLASAVASAKVDEEGQELILLRQGFGGLIISGFATLTKI